MVTFKLIELVAFFAAADLIFHNRLRQNPVTGATRRSVAVRKMTTRGLGQAGKEAGRLSDGRTGSQAGRQTDGKAGLHACSVSMIRLHAVISLYLTLLFFFSAAREEAAPPLPPMRIPAAQVSLATRYARTRVYSKNNVGFFRSYNLHCQHINMA